MYIEVKTWLSTGDLVYRIMHSKIETWKVTKVGVHINDTLNKETEYFIYYNIEPVIAGPSNAVSISQKDLQEKFCREKKILIQQLLDQL